MNNRLTSGEFATICNTTKETLRHYKNLELFCPRYVDDNGYSYYDVEQFYDFYIISILKKTGTPLKKIKDFVNHNDLETILSILELQEKILKMEQQKLMEMAFMIKSTSRNIKMGLSKNSTTPQIAYFEHEHHFVMPLNELDLVQIDDLNDISLIKVLDLINKFCSKEKALTDYQLGANIDPVTKGVTHMYVKTDKKYSSKYYHEKPAGNYLYFIKKSSWDLQESYNIFFEYMQNNNIKPIGNIYAYDLAGFLVNINEENSMSMICVRL
ncbi:MAG: hypothetical protein BEN19_00840 [Epulopiscium sp. Nuni2H_MBin003]|nr:MAG: hypothetical protein BEN19_00840 [Epulopiscium sp. Nuni2H_MBin003]